MATCKECLHVDACACWVENFTGLPRDDFQEFRGDNCGNFKDKSKYVEQKHGHWILVAENSTGDIYVCSVCNFPHNPNKRDVELVRVEEEPDYCCKCGAKMDGEQ